MLFLLLLLPYLKDFLDFRSETTYISTVAIYFNHRGGRGGEVKGVDVKNHTALVTFILIHYAKSPDENRAILHFRKSFEKGGI